MSQFVPAKLEVFLGVIRKYMQVRGGMSQKDLAEATGVGVSTMSRFLSQKTSELNPQLIAKIVAKLNVPLHEVIDFVEESYADHFIRLVKFYKAEEQPIPGNLTANEMPADPIANTGPEEMDTETEIASALSSGPSSSQQKASASVNVGANKSKVVYEPEQSKASEKSIREKMESLTTRQKGFLTEFLNLDMDGRDLVVDIGKNIITYLRQKGMDF